MVDLTITFLGTSAAIPTPKRGLSSLIISRGNELLLFDTGEGMQKNFLMSKLGINKKMKIFLTHMHADHCIGILGLFQTMTHLGRTKNIDIFGEPRLKEYLVENIRIINFRLSFDINIHIIKNEGILVNESDYQITCCNSNHSVLSYSYCIEEFLRPGIFNINKVRKLGIPEGNLYRKLQIGETIIYNGLIVKSNQIVGPKRKGRKIGISGDTRPSLKLQHFFKNCDVLIFESTYDDKNLQKAVETFHSTSKEAATLAEASGTRKLILTHFSARYNDVSLLFDDARKIHNDTEIAEDLKKIIVPYTE